MNEQETYFHIHNIIQIITRYTKILSQTSGETQYTGDLPQLERELSAVIVPSQQALGTITNIDTKKALVSIGHLV